MNLIEIQEAIKNVPLQNLMQYANGRNPEVPAYLATAELLRRKQIEDSSKMGNAPQEPLKDQLAKSLAGSDMSPMQELYKRQLQMNQQPQAMNQPQQTGQNGIESIQTPGMFKQSSFASGGIVAFASPKAETVGQAAEQYADPMTGISPESNPDGVIPSFDPNASRINPDRRDALIKRDRERRNMLPLVTDWREDPNKQFREASEKAGTRTTTPPDWSKLPAGANAPRDTNVVIPEDVAPKKEAPAKEKPAGTTNPSAAPAAKPELTLPALPANDSAAFTHNITLPENMTPEQFREKQLKEQGLWGILQNPYADTQKRYADIEARRAQDRAAQPQSELRELLSSIALADPTKGLAGAGGAGAKAYDKMVKENQDLRHKEDLEMAQLHQVIAKEQDALRRGDMGKYHEFQKERSELEAKIAENEVKQRQVKAQDRQNQIEAWKGDLTRLTNQYKLPYEIKELLARTAAHNRPNQFESWFSAATKAGIPANEAAGMFVGRANSIFSKEDSFKQISNDPEFFGKPLEEKIAAANALWRAMNPATAMPRPKDAPADARLASDGKWYTLVDPKKNLYKVWE